MDEENRFEIAIEQSFRSLRIAQQVLLDQLEINVAAIYEASGKPVGIGAIVVEVMDTPLTRCATCSPAEPDTKIPVTAYGYVRVEKDPDVEDGKFGVIQDLTRIQNAGNGKDGNDFYHHCDKRGGKLVRIVDVKGQFGYICPVCEERFVSHDRTGRQGDF